MARKQCFLVCSPSWNMARKQCFLVLAMFPGLSTFIDRKQCSLVFVHLLGTWRRNNVSWFVHLLETCLQNNVSFFVHHHETWIGNNVSCFVYLHHIRLEQRRQIAATRRSNQFHRVIREFYQKFRRRERILSDMLCCRDKILSRQQNINQ